MDDEDRDAERAWSQGFIDPQDFIIKTTLDTPTFGGVKKLAGDIQGGSGGTLPTISAGSGINVVNGWDDTITLSLNKADTPFYRQLEGVEDALARFLDDRTDDNFAALLNRRDDFDMAAEALRQKIEHGERIREIAQRVIEQRVTT